MDSKDFKNVCMTAGGVALAAAGTAAMYASTAPATLDISMDAASIAAAIATGAMTGGMGLALLGLAPLVVKYGYKFYQLVKQKLRENHRISEKDADKMMQQTLSKEREVASKGNTKEGEMTDVMKKASDRGAPINNPPSNRRSARNPVNRKISKVQVLGKQVQR